jgi:hypothetical protein
MGSCFIAATALKYRLNGRNALPIVRSADRLRRYISPFIFILHIITVGISNLLAVRPILEAHTLLPLHKVTSLIFPLLSYFLLASRSFSVV